MQLGWALVFSPHPDMDIVAISHGMEAPIGANNNLNVIRVITELTSGSCRD